jgi:hypothetical protein
MMMVSTVHRMMEGGMRDLMTLSLSPMALHHLFSDEVLSLQLHSLR